MKSPARSASIQGTHSPNGRQIVKIRIDFFRWFFQIEIGEDEYTLSIPLLPVDLNDTIQIVQPLSVDERLK